MKCCRSSLVEQPWYSSHFKLRSLSISNLGSISNLVKWENNPYKSLDLGELNNFGIHHFLSWNHLGAQILVWTSETWQWNMCNISNSRCKFCEQCVLRICQMWTTLVFITFSFEINWGSKIWFELVVFQIFLKKTTWNMILKPQMVSTRKVM
jgi:hypothetical protein